MFSRDDVVIALPAPGSGSVIGSRADARPSTILAIV